MKDEQAIDAFFAWYEAGLADGALEACAGSLDEAAHRSAESVLACGFS